MEQKKRGRTGDKTTSSIEKGAWSTTLLELTMLSVGVDEAKVAETFGKIFGEPCSVVEDAQEAQP